MKADAKMEVRVLVGSLEYGIVTSGLERS